MPPERTPLAVRFWAKVDKSGDCWLWTGALKENGYGVIGGHERRSRYAHRVSYQLAFGAVPPGLNVLHRCDNRRCVRPDHLFAGTQAENIQDMVRKGRARPYDRRGRKNPRAVLTPGKAAEIRARRQSGETLASIAARFSVGTSQVHRIATGRSWQ